MSLLRDLWEGLADQAVRALRKAGQTSRQQEMEKNRRGIVTPVVDYQTGQTFLSPAEAYLKIEQSLLGRYAEIEAMERWGDTGTVLNVYADNATQQDGRKKKAIWPVSKDRVVQRVIEELFTTLNLESQVWSMIRSMCKYGDNYEELVFDPNGRGIIGLQNLQAHTMRRVEDGRGRHIGFVQDLTGRGGLNFDQYRALIQAKIEGKLPDMLGSQFSGPMSGFQHPQYVPFEPFEIAHFRLRIKDRHSYYGVSVLDHARAIWKQAAALEDGAVLHQLQHAQDRLVYYVDVGFEPMEKVNAALELHKNRLSKKRVIDPSTNQLSLKFNPLSMEDNIIVPVRGGQDQSRVETLPARGWPSSELLEFFKNGWYSSSGVPRSYVAQSDVIDKQPLASKDVQFARAILRVQQAYIETMRDVAIIQLQLRDLHRPEKEQFTLRMTMPSAIYELALLEVNNARADLAQRLDSFFSRYWILQNIFDLTDEEIQQEFNRKSEDLTRSSTGEAAAQAAATEILPPPAVEGKGYRIGRAWGEQDLMEGRTPSKQETREIKRKLDEILKREPVLLNRLTRTHALLEEMKHTSDVSRGLIQRANR